MDMKNVLMNLLKIDPIILCIYENIYCIKCSKYREFKNFKTSNILNKILVFLFFLISGVVMILKCLRKKNLLIY